MAYIFLRWKNPACNGKNIEWEEMKPRDFFAFMRSDESKGRYFVKLNNDICLEADVIFIETTEEKYREWYKEFCRHRYINRGKADRTILSLDAPLGEEETGSLYDVIAYEDTSVEEAVISPELLRFLYVAVSSLSKRAREAIEAKYFTYAGWPDSAIAEAMGIDVDVFQKRKRRAIENLKNFFK